MTDHSLVPFDIDFGNASAVAAASMVENDLAPAASMAAAAADVVNSCIAKRLETADSADVVVEHIVEPVDMVAIAGTVVGMAAEVAVGMVRAGMVVAIVVVVLVEVASVVAVLVVEVPAENVSALDCFSHDTLLRCLAVVVEHMVELLQPVEHDSWHWQTRL